MSFGNYLAPKCNHKISQFFILFISETQNFMYDIHGIFLPKWRKIVITKFLHFYLTETQIFLHDFSKKKSYHFLMFSFIIISYSFLYLYVPSLNIFHSALPYVIINRVWTNHCRKMRHFSVLLKVQSDYSITQTIAISITILVLLDN